MTASIFTEYPPKSRKQRPLEERFWEKVNKTDTCWLWTRALSAGPCGGYGKFTLPCGIDTAAHRVSWEMANNMPVPDGLFVLHHCDVRHCVRPEHLYVGTSKENRRDAKDRGRLPDFAGEKHWYAKITDADAMEIYNLYKTGNYMQRELGDRFGMSQSAISMITTGEGWKHLGLTKIHTPTGSTRRSYLRSLRS